MSQPDPSRAATSSRSSSLSPTSVPLRVVAERLSTEEAQAADEADRVRRSELAAVGHGGPVAGSTAAAAEPAPPVRAATTLTSRPAGASPALPVLAPVPARCGGLGDLLRLVTGRRRCGRHRPGALKRRGWSMFAPQRRRGRRWTR